MQYKILHTEKEQPIYLFRFLEEYEKAELKSYLIKMYNFKWENFSDQEHPYQQLIFIQNKRIEANKNYPTKQYTIVNAVGITTNNTIYFIIESLSEKNCKVFLIPNHRTSNLYACSFPYCLVDSGIIVSDNEIVR